MNFYVYIIANRRRGALHVDVANDLARPGCERREKALSGFGARHPPRLVYYEELPNVLAALARERQIRACSRDWKIARIEYTNPDWRDLTKVPPVAFLPPNSSFRPGRDAAFNGASGNGFAGPGQAPPAAEGQGQGAGANPAGRSARRSALSSGNRRGGWSPAFRGPSTSR
jgi:putative endonuclease